MKDVAVAVALVSGLAAAPVAAQIRPPAAAPGASGRTSTGSRSQPSAMTPETAFFYYLAIYGSPPDVVDRYARRFDAVNFNRAMADAAQRGPYRQRVQDKIARTLRELDFQTTFVFTAPAMLDDYSRAAQAFPILGAQELGDHFYFSFYAEGGGFDVHPMLVRDAVNASAFNWSVPMPQADAAAWIGAHRDRRVTLRITYSVTKGKGDDAHNAYFKPQIRSVEAFADEQMTKKLGTAPAAAPPEVEPGGRAQVIAEPPHDAGQSALDEDPAADHGDGWKRRVRVTELPRD
jgi:hypothetical protein